MRSFSGEMPFSRASAVMASRISRDIELLLHEVRSCDVAVRDGDDAGVGGDRHRVVRGADQLARERAVAVVVVARPYARAPAEEPAEVVGLGEWALRSRRGDLERVRL